jgi:hypothetical protein
VQLLCQIPLDYLTRLLMVGGVLYRSSSGKTPENEGSQEIWQSGVWGIRCYVNSQVDGCKTLSAAAEGVTAHRET